MADTSGCDHLDWLFTRLDTAIHYWAWSCVLFRLVRFVYDLQNTSQEMIEIHTHPTAMLPHCRTVKQSSQTEIRLQDAQRSLLLTTPFLSHYKCETKRSHLCETSIQPLVQLSDTHTITRLAFFPSNTKSHSIGYVSFPSMQTNSLVREPTACTAN